MVKPLCKRLLLSLQFALTLALIFPAQLSAFTYQGIRYSVLDEAAKTAKVESHNTATGDLVLPETVYDESNTPYKLVSIADYAFYGCNRILSVEIPKSITAIGRDAFWYCGLAIVKISDLSAWCKINFGSSPFSTYDLVLNGEKISDLVIPDDITEIKDNAFSYCSSLTSVEIPNSVTEIGDQAFFKCSSLTSIEIPNSVTKIGSRAFTLCSSLTSVVIPNSVTVIGDEVFSDCSSLNSVEIPNSVTKIGSYTFLRCRSLNSVKIPNSVTEISSGAFCESSLTSVEIPNSVTEIGRRTFSECRSLTSVEIPYSVTEIGDWAFYLCSSLTSVKIPNSMTEIGDAAFCDCSSLKRITLPKSLTTIVGSAFYGCQTLTSITSLAVTPPVCTGETFNRTFNGVSKKKCILYVPTESMDAYKQAPVWKEFGIIEEADPALGIEDSDASEIARPNDIHNMQGVCLKRNASQDDINALAPGLYIVAGKKVVVK